MFRNLFKARGPISLGRNTWGRPPTRIIVRPTTGYQRFQSNREPFYNRKQFWIGAGIFGGLSGTYYVTHLETVPISGRRRFMDISPSQEEKLSKMSYQEIIQEYGHQILPPNHRYSRWVSDVAQRIIRVSGMDDLKWEVHVIDSPERNAFVLPGGKVFVFTGILPIVQSKDGMAAVLGHEVAHQVARHSAEKMSYMKILFLFQLFLDVALGMPFALNRLFLELGVVLPFSRKCEVEADMIGLQLMAQACYDPYEAVRMWERMSQAEKGAPPQYLSTHPNNESRISKINEWMPQALQTRANSDCDTDMMGLAEKFKKHWVSW
ncbi:hypothetical protein K493DRAFT_312781 [Basidiobolus meristosporus CBS 931.73]|uniref:Peptidase M48 domain-containing protein n=1 Tax=Basidiobolus meristosporus CBS 931.73 TaxID=1314790 RepID=A0A1Y1YRB8_9FUNG|nr:hypothetical protein K493DRAFT_312781 [Basidiobolus meristosporus CBS 931.73]|eukprot:ORY00572.1 hypothetical protein K493DRAFT_312781 [Basidiobolus meristosporus CBS 931.73]